MASFKIPVKFKSPDFSFQIDLDKTIFGFRFRYNERTDRFSMEIQDQAGNAIISGVAMVSNWPVLSRFKSSLLPKGLLFTMDATGGSNEPNAINFGDTVLLCYQEAGT